MPLLVWTRLVRFTSLLWVFGTAIPLIQLGISVGITGLQVRDNEGNGGEGGIRTLDTGVSPYNGLANRRLQPLGHLSDARDCSLPRPLWSAVTTAFLNRFNIDRPLYRERASTLLASTRMPEPFEHNRKVCLSRTRIHHCRRITAAILTGRERQGEGPQAGVRRPHR